MKRKGAVIKALFASCALWPRESRGITAASDRLAEVERGIRRNLLRSLSLDAFAAGLEK